MLIPEQLQFLNVVQMLPCRWHADMLTPEQHLQRQLEHALREGFRDSSAAAELAGRLAAAGRAHGHRLPHSCLGSFLALLQVTAHAMLFCSRQGVQHDAHALQRCCKGRRSLWTGTWCSILT